MENITLSKDKYMELKRQAGLYRKFAAQFFAMNFDSIEDIVEDFKKTDIYSKPFLKDLENGLKKSSYARRNETKTIKERPSSIS